MNGCSGSPSCDSGIQNAARVTLSAASGAGTGALVRARPLAQIRLSAAASWIFTLLHFNQRASELRVELKGLSGEMIGTKRVAPRTPPVPGAR